MRGILIWHSHVDFGAVIWCEDSQGLAVASGPTAWRNPMAELSVGDYVSFSDRVVDGVRQCRDIHLIESNVAPHLPDSIMKAISSEVPTSLDAVHDGLNGYHDDRYGDDRGDVICLRSYSKRKSTALAHA